MCSRDRRCGWLCQVYGHTYVSQTRRRRRASTWHSQFTNLCGRKAGSLKQIRLGDLLGEGVLGAG
jgi:hypothetical protein